VDDREDWMYVIEVLLDVLVLHVLGREFDLRMT